MLSVVVNEGVHIEHADKVMLEAYVLGNVSGHDLLTHACQFKDLSSYQKWLKSNPNGRDGNESSNVSVEQIVAQVRAYITRKYWESLDAAR